MSLAATLTRSSWTPDAVRDAVRASLGRDIVSQFHRLWYDTATTWSMTRYRGIPALKNPCDMQICHELIHELRPTLIIETGTAFGGSALHFADCLAMAGNNGRVVTIDTKNSREFENVDQITCLIGSSIDPEIVAQVAWHVARSPGPVMVTLDSDHARDHVLAELDAYAGFVTPGSFLIVEDTNLGGHPIPIGMIDGGPGAAVDLFLESPVGQHFEREILAERYLLTMHPNGWLRRTKETD